MNPYNPYQAPQQMNEGNPAAYDNAQAVILESLKKTRPWVLFLSILGFLGAGAMVLLGLFVMLAGSSFSAATKGAFPGLGPAIGFLYIVLAGFYVVPSVLLWRYASSISQFSISGGSMDSLATAVKAQTSFWRYVGILTASIMGLYFVGIFLAIVIGAVAAASR